MWFIMDGRTAHLSSEPIKWPRPTTPRALAHKYPGSSRLERPREQISSAWIYPSVKTPNGSLPRHFFGVLTMKKKEEKGRKTGAAGAAKRGAAPPQAAETGGADVSRKFSRNCAMCARAMCALLHPL